MSAGPYNRPLQSGYFMSFEKIIEWIRNFISSLLMPAGISILGTYLDPNLADITDFGVEIGNILPQTWSTYLSFLISPGAAFNLNALSWNIQYLSTALALGAFAFSYLVPPIEYSKKNWVNWVFKILLSKIAGAIYKSGILLLSLIYFIIYMSIFCIVALLSMKLNFMHHFKLLVYSFGTIYITFSLILFLEHFVSLLFKKKSMLKYFAHIVDEDHEPSAKEQDCMNKIGQKRKTRELKLPQWMPRSLREKANERGKQGRYKGDLFLCIISTYQRVLFYCLIIFSIVYPFYCLGMTDI
jgi:hypothetical protein